MAAMTGHYNGSCETAANEACSPPPVATSGKFAADVNDAVSVNTEGVGHPTATTAMRIIRTTLVFIAFLVHTTSPQAQTAAPRVDLCLVLAADMSASISSQTARMQREGHAQALTQSDVLSAIARTRTGRIAVTYIEWSSYGTAYTVLPWRIIGNARDARDAADVIRAGGYNPGQHPIGLLALVGRSPSPAIASPTAPLLPTAPSSTSQRI
ncbi:DUF1194 domain-containing protein [Mesorhizobium sp. C120A]|uniref:DUF1194 domain-containing protein n=1 Tax=Mesorhizobium sp. C120A TaxID=2956824 RepID=UPI0009DE7CF4